MLNSGCYIVIKLIWKLIGNLLYKFYETMPKSSIKCLNKNVKRWYYLVNWFLVINVMFCAAFSIPCDNNQRLHCVLCIAYSISDRVQFWGIDIKYGEGVRTAEMLFVSTYPTVLIIGLKNNSQHCLYRTSRPAVSIDLLKEKIEQGMYMIKQNLIK